jgi:gliding motility-associated-like protein
VTDTIYISQRAQALYNGNLPASAAFSWRFPGGSLLNGSGPGPLELGYSETGTQKVFLQIDHQGCISPEVSREIVVLPIPSSRFFISNDSVCTGTLVWANYEGQVVPQAAYNWFFDGATVLSGTGAGPYQLDWNTSGLKRVRLEILINGQSSGVWEESVRVIEMPRAPFTLSNSVCAGSAVKPAFTGTQSNSNLFSWSFDGGDAQNTGTAEPSLSWSTPGLKTVTLSIADAMCISILESRSIMVYAIPEATFSAPEYVCPDAEAVIVFTGNAGNDADLNWNIGDAIGDQPSATEAFKLKWLSPGFRQLSLRVVENGCSSVVYTHQLDVKTKPVVNAGIDRLLCASDTISLQAEGNSGLSFKWEPSAGLSSDSVAHPLLSLQAIHNYVDTLFYKVMAADGFCTASDTLMVTLAPMPEAFIASPDPQCLEGNSFDFKAEGNFTNDATFSWNFGAHAYSHSPWEKNQQDIHFENAGEYPVSLIISQYGCTGKPFTRNVKINGHPKADFSIRPAKGCIPLNSTFTAHNGSAGNTYAWQFGDGSEGQGKQTGHVYAVSGYMSVVLTVSDSNGCKTTLKRPEAVEVLERPVAGFRVDPEMAYLGDKIDLTNLSHNTKYSYYIINNDTILGATSAYTFKEPGTHVITQVVVNAQGCEDEISHNVRIEHGSSLFIPSAFTPNNDGTNDLFRIEGTDLFQYNLIVFDRWGSEVFKSRDMKEGWNGYSASGEPLPEGVYGFILEARDKDNQNIHEVGQVTLIR